MAESPAGGPRAGTRAVNAQGEIESALEAAIDLATLRCQMASTPTRRRAAFEELRELIAQRSPAQVRRMESERGLSQ